MAKNLIACGEVFDYVVPTSGTVASGDPVLLTDILGAALISGVEADVVPVQVEGVFSFPKVTGSSGKAFTQGQKVYFVTSSKSMDNTDNSAANKHVGYAFKAAATLDTTVQVRLLG